MRGDLVAGLTVAVVLIPQSMAYAILAGLPPVFGLYAAAVTPAIAGLWGSLRQLATGPIAIMSLLVLTTLAPFAEPGTSEFIRLAILLAFMVGVIYLGIGLFRLGEVMSFISHSAVRGFTSAAAIIITTTQLPHLLGVSVPRKEFIVSMLLALAEKIPGLHVPTTLVGLLALATIFVIQRVKKDFPASLIAIVVGTALVYALDLEQAGIEVVGQIPGGLPGLQIPFLDFRTFCSLIGPAVIIALVSFAETYSVGKALSTETKQKVDVDQEFIGQGLANIVGSFFQSYPVSGSFSRTAVSYASGAKTGIASVISALSVVVALLYLTPLIALIPKTALAALVISAVMTLFHPKAVFHVWKMNRHDGIVAVSVFSLSLLTKPDYALLIGVMISLMFFLWKTMHPRIVRISKDPELNMFVNADVFDKPSCPQILQLRSDNEIYFANAEYTVAHILERLDEQTTPVKFLLLDLEAMGFVDITGVDELRVLLDETRTRKMALALMGIHLPVMAVFKSSGFIRDLNPKYLIKRRGDAIGILFPDIDHDYCRSTCPYKLFYECSTVK